jgi:hypothetical protein
MVGEDVPRGRDARAPGRLSLCDGANLGGCIGALVIALCRSADTHPHARPPLEGEGIESARFAHGQRAMQQITTPHSTFNQAGYLPISVTAGVP